MAWIESHQELARHPKTRKAARALGVSIPTMVGHLHCLWHECLDLAEEGDLSRWDAEDVATAAMWDGDPHELLDALLSCGYAGGPGFLERDGLYGPPDDPRKGELVLHDWWEYAGKLIERRRRDRQRKSAARSAGQDVEVSQSSTGRPQDGPQDVQGMSGPHARTRARATRPDPTEPDPTEPTAGASRGKPRSDRATRIPDGWTPAEDKVHDEAKAAGVDLHRELERFRDYWQAQGGAKSRKVDWQATWRNWVRRAIDDKPKANGRPPPGGYGSKGADYAARYEAAAAQARSEGR